MLVPQLWIIPVFISIIIYSNGRSENKYGFKDESIPKIFLLLNKLMVLFMIINISIIFLCSSIMMIWGNDGMRYQLNMLKKYDKVYVHLELFETATRLKLDKWGINYIEDNKKGLFKLDLKADRSKPYFDKEKYKIIPFWFNFQINEAGIPKKIYFEKKEND